MTRLSALLAVALICPAARAGATTLDALKGMSAAGREAAASGSPQDAKQGSGAGFDSSGRYDDSLSPPPVTLPEAGTQKRPGATLIVGEPGKHKIRDVENPLTKDGKAKEQSSGNGLWWTLGGAAVGGIAGFLLGGPIGAAIGAVVGGLLGWFFGP